MTKESIAVKYYRLAPKALRHMIALKEYEKRLEELSKLSDEEIIRLVEKEK